MMASDGQWLSVDDALWWLMMAMINDGQQWLYGV